MTTNTMFGTHSPFNNGQQVLTVGEGGQFATIQAAIDYIETQDAFTPITMSANGAVTVWAQNATTFTPSTTATTSAGAFVTPVPFEKVWFKVADDTFYYPLEEVVGTAHASQKISTIRRIEASLGGAKAMTWYKQNDFTIMLLDAYTSEAFTISDNVFVNFIGTSRNVLQMSVTKTANFKSGKLAFSDLIVSAITSGGAFWTGWDSVNTIAIEFFGGEIASVHDDFILPTTKYGSIRAEGVIVTQQPTAAQGHCFAPDTTQGDIVLQNIVWRPIAHSSLTGLSWDNAFLVDLAATARKIIISGVNAFIRNKYGDFIDIAIFGSTNRVHTADVHISDCHIIAPDSSTTNFQIAILGAVSTGCSLTLTGNTIDANTSGTVKLVDAGANPAGACTVKVGRGNSVVKCDVQANITYTMAAAGVGGTATVASGATTSVVTHGLGYAPNVADIQVVPTLLSNAAKWWITATGATTFQINVDADPGAGTATFAWRIGL